MNYQLAKLRRASLHAAQHVPYYRRVLAEADVVAGGAVKLENFARVPLLTKDVIRREGSNMTPRITATAAVSENTSGGSTGVPVRFLKDKAYDAMNTATKIFFFEQLGKEFCGREIKLWGSDGDILAGNLTRKDRAINFLYNRRFFNCYDFSRDQMLRLAELNNHFQPDAYWAYVDALFAFSEFVIKQGIPLKPPKAIVTTIGPLYADQKTVMEKAFGCNVYNQYGSREVGVVSAHERNANDMNVFFWRVFVEVVPVADNPVEEGGKLVITSLYNGSMPLIRYDIGDVAIPGDRVYDIGNTKSCLSLNNVVGRTLGFFRKADGTLKHTHFIETVQQLFFKDWIGRSQVAQEEYDRVVIRVVKAGEPVSADMQDIVRKSKILLGDEFKVDFEFVEEIPCSPSGKVLYTVCNLKQ